jgi:cellulose synthase/poly-beta-1,6-N-acetylglucosamine synthase-like glycosyltransferase
MLNHIIATLCLLSVFLIVYHHLIYPLILGRLGRHVAAGDEADGSAQMTDDELPSITLIIPAYNEEKYIADKIRNIGAMDYPASKVTVRILGDGCVDQTFSIACDTANEEECRHLNISVRGFRNNRGKAMVLNEALQDADSDIIVFSDVSALVSLDALRIIGSRFLEPTVGVISSNYQLLNPGSEGESSYWLYQRKLKQRESSLGGLLGAHGAFYAFRRELFEPFEPDTINDDFILPMRIVARGYKGIYASDVNALELEQSTRQMDIKRRKRIAAGNVQQAIRLRRLLAPGFGALAFTFGSGKVLRVAMPWLMLLALFSSLWLSIDSLFFALLAAAQLALYAIAALTHFRDKEHTSKLCATIHYLVSGHLSNMLGAITYLNNRSQRLF